MKNLIRFFLLPGFVHSCIFCNSYCPHLQKDVSKRLVNTEGLLTRSHHIRKRRSLLLSPYFIHIGYNIFVAVLKTADCINLTNKTAISSFEPWHPLSSDVTQKKVFCREGVDATISGQYKVTCLTASSLGRRYVCRYRVFPSTLCCGVCEWRHLLQQRHRGLAEGLNHSHGNAQSWELADKHKHSPYQNTQTWKTTP